MSAGGVVDMTRAVGDNVEVRRVIGDLTLESSQPINKYLCQYMKLIYFVLYEYLTTQHERTYSTG